MKILICGLNYHPELTGIGKYTGEMAEWLANKGHEIKIVTAPPYYPKWETAKGYSSVRYKKEHLNGVDVIRCPLYIPRKPTGLTRILHHLSYFLSSFFAILYLASWRPHVVINIIPSFFSTVVTLFGASFYNAKTCLHIQDFELDTALGLGILKISSLKRVAEAIERFIFRRFDHISTISASMLRKLSQKGIDPSTTFLFPNWVDTNTIFPLEGSNAFRNTLNLNPGDIAALYSGNMGVKQGLDMIVDVARKLNSKTNIRFILCGDGPEKSKLMSLSSGLTNIIFLPLQPKKKLNLLLNLADIHLLPQKPEAADLVMPSKLTGIFASGKPVVAIAAHGTEVEKAVKNRGIVVKPCDIEGFKHVIEWLTSHPDERRKLGKAARAYAIDRFDKKIILSQFDDRLRELVNIEHQYCEKSNSLC